MRRSGSLDIAGGHVPWCLFIAERCLHDRHCRTPTAPACSTSVILPGRQTGPAESGNIYAIGIDFEFSAQAPYWNILPLCLVAQSALSRWAECHFIVIVPCETFPAAIVFFEAEHHHVVNLTDGIIPVLILHRWRIFITGAIIRYSLPSSSRNIQGVPVETHSFRWHVFETRPFWGVDNAVPHEANPVNWSGIEQHHARNLHRATELRHWSSSASHELALEAGRTKSQSTRFLE